MPVDDVSPGDVIEAAWGDQVRVAIAALEAADAAHAAAGDPHAGYATDADLAAHVAAADPHPGYVLESLFDAAGDLLVASADNTPAKLAKGGNNTHLGVSAAGAVAWITRAGWQLERTANQAIPANTDTAITFPTETTDTDGFHAANAAAITIPAGMAGWYAIAGFASFSSDGTGARFCWLGKNGAGTMLSGAQAPSGTLQRELNASAVVYLAAGDTVALYVNTVGGTPNVNPARFTGVYLGA